ncbi:DUF4150 domain-containing protein [Marimonas sp. MJW-29]|uniref:DUF4150 domain-containing protein n=1 Tax=Sulfitobacter sediminis TaxID=3234186 RepID=A0ABV3RLX9_9RHOB
MSLKPKKPKKKLFAKLKPLDDAVAQSKNTAADTKALEGAKKELDKATKQLETAMMKSFQCHEKAYKLAPNIDKTPETPSPVPIPYPTLQKLEKETKSALKVTEKALKNHEKVQKKLVKLLDREIKVLKSGAKSSKGDEAGTLKGLTSAKTMGKAQWVQYSVNVKAEGKAVTRMLDLMSDQHPKK